MKHNWLNAINFYFLWIFIICAAAYSQKSPLLFAYLVGAPEKVPDISIYRNGHGSVNVTWGEPFNNFDPITNYSVECQTDDEISCGVVNVSGNATKYCLISDLKAATSYTFSVKAINSIGIGEAGVKRITAGTVHY